MCDGAGGPDPAVAEDVASGVEVGEERAEVEGADWELEYCVVER